MAATSEATVGRVDETFNIISDDCDWVMVNFFCLLFQVMNKEAQGVLQSLLKSSLNQ